MAKRKKEIKVKEPVRIREKVLGDGTISAYITWTDESVPDGYYPLRAVVYFYGRTKESTGGARGQNFLIFNENGNLDRTSTIGSATLFTGIYPA